MARALLINFLIFVLLFFTASFAFAGPITAVLLSPFVDCDSADLRAQFTGTSNVTYYFLYTYDNGLNWYSPGSKSIDVVTSAVVSEHIILFPNQNVQYKLLYWYGNKSGETVIDSFVVPPLPTNWPIESPNFSASFSSDGRTYVYSFSAFPDAFFSTSVSSSLSGAPFAYELYERVDDCNSQSCGHHCDDGSIFRFNGCNLPLPQYSSGSRYTVRLYLTELEVWSYPSSQSTVYFSVLCSRIKYSCDLSTAYQRVLHWDGTSLDQSYSTFLARCLDNHSYGFQGKGANVNYKQGALKRFGRVGFGVGGFEKVIQ